MDKAGMKILLIFLVCAGIEFVAGNKSKGEDNATIHLNNDTFSSEISNCMNSTLCSVDFESVCVSSAGKSIEIPLNFTCNIFADVFNCSIQCAISRWKSFCSNLEKNNCRVDFNGSMISNNTVFSSDCSGIKIDFAEDNSTCGPEPHNTTTPSSTTITTTNSPVTTPVTTVFTIFPTNSTDHPNATTSAPEKKKHLNSGEITAIVIVVLIAVVVLAYVIWRFRFRKTPWTGTARTPSMQELNSSLRFENPMYDNQL